MASKKSDRPVLKVKKRKILGRKVKQLRQEQILPANLYGKKIKSLAIKANLKETTKIFDEAGETSLVDLLIEGERQAKPVLLQNPQFDPVTDQMIHLDFYQVDLTEKVTADIPVEISGEAPIAEKGEGVLVQLINEVEVEALPTDLPEKFIVDVSSLTEVDQGITVGEMTEAGALKTDKVAVKVSADQLVVKIEPPAKEEVVEEKPAEEEVAPEGEEKPEEEGKEKKEPGKEEKEEEEKEEGKEKQGKEESSQKK